MRVLHSNCCSLPQGNFCPVRAAFKLHRFRIAARRGAARLPDRSRDRVSSLSCHPGRTSASVCAKQVPLHIHAQRMGQTISTTQLCLLVATFNANAEDAEAASGVSDPVISVLFTVAIACLAVLTIGVLYLSYITWIDQRAEKQDRERFDQSEADRKPEAVGVRKSPSKRKQKSNSSSGGRGFGN